MTQELKYFNQFRFNISLENVLVISSKLNDDLTMHLYFIHS